MATGDFWRNEGILEEAPRKVSWTFSVCNRKETISSVIIIPLLRPLLTMIIHLRELPGCSFYHISFTRNIQKQARGTVTRELERERDRENLRESERNRTYIQHFDEFRHFFDTWDEVRTPTGKSKVRKSLSLKRLNIIDRYIPVHSQHSNTERKLKQRLRSHFETVKFYKLHTKNRNCPH